MESAEKMPLHGFPIGIAEAIDLPDNHAYIKASPNFFRNRKVEPDILAHVEEELDAVARVEEPVVPARVEEPVVPARVEEPVVPAGVEEPVTSLVEKPVTAHVEGRRKLKIPRSFSCVNEQKGAIDTTPPIESVKEAVSRFGGSIDWKARRAQNIQQRPKSMGVELEISDEIAELRRQVKFQLPEDLYSTNKLTEELKQNLERAQREEHEATQASEAARLKAEELEQEIAHESRHAAALSDLNSTNEELERLHDEYACMVIQKDIAVKMAEEAVAASKKIEQSLKYLTFELESLKLARTSSLRAADKDCCNWKLELQHAEEKLQRLNQQALAMKDLKSKLGASSSLLLHLKSELAAYMESKLKQEGDEEPKKALEKVKINIEKASAELDSVITTIRRSEETVSVAVASLKAELETKSQIASIEMKNKGAREMIDFDKKVEQAAQEADYAKSLAQAAQIELRKAKEDVEQAKTRASAVESRLQAAQTELEDAKYYEKVAIEAVKALQESESVEKNYDTDSPSEVTLGLKEYYELRERAHEAEKSVDLRVVAANSQIEIAKDSELNSLNKLEEVNQELAARRESLKMATEKAEKAQEGKLGAEQELRKWKADQVQKRNASLELKKESNKSDQTNVHSNNTASGSAPETESKKKKKKQLFPRVIMFFSKRKARRNK
ncbi:protein WEAK CHLOROPLAST MOVEMENT UNDER BLUE LIGHT 1-like [Neltuma alba]|uniref:protein WEAK CHLOROPLAST MOVEMENT UNDER BLUE LIGHT 1-like n=1 Tax=Neltuma alba TaxID=207710 RepID=UPI0010A492BC|nr:protein WEAK CHLOROPLAST MOVEMENT UNDER BLUE LIGHT 1-like [Prosopis alba]